jgi:uncharacterized protein (TIGR03086 family)
MPEFELRAAADRMTRLVAGVRDEQLPDPTPCPDFDVAALVAHIDGFAQAFTAAARKDLGELTSSAPGEPPALADGWRGDVAVHLDQLADAFGADEAWEGMTQAGGVDLPGAVAAGVALDELVVHGWDLARATGQPFDVDDADVVRVEAMVQQFRAGSDGEIPGLFGPAVPVAADAGPLDRLLASTGRDPAWRPSGG